MPFFIVWILLNLNFIFLDLFLLQIDFLVKICHLDFDVFDFLFANLDFFLEVVDILIDHIEIFLDDPEQSPLTTTQVRTALSDYPWFGSVRVWQATG